MPSTIGGQLINGGFISQASAADTLPGVPPWASQYSRRIAVWQCELAQQWNERPLFIAGLLGCPTTRRISFQAQFAFTLPFDSGNPLEVAVAGGSGQPAFRQRDPFQLQFIAGYNPLAAAPFALSKSWFAPRCVADIITPIWDEENDPRKMLGQRIIGHSRGYTFLWTDDGAPNDAMKPCGAYCQYLANNQLI